MFDLQALAFQADITRVFTFMLGREQSNRPYPRIGVPEAHHASRTTRTIRRSSRRRAKINTYHIELFARLRREAAVDAGRRRHAARPLDDAVRQRPEQQRSALAHRPAARRRRRRRPARQGRPPSRFAEGHADDQPASCRCSTRSACRSRSSATHRAARRSSRWPACRRRRHPAMSEQFRRCAYRPGARHCGRDCRDRGHAIR